MGLGVRGLEEFGLSLRSLKALERVQVDVEVGLAPKMYDQRLARLPHTHRLALFKSLKQKSIEHVRKIWPTQPIHFEGDRSFPCSFKSMVEARLIPKLAEDKEIDSIRILRVPGHRKRRLKKIRSLSWFAVRALVVIEVEGQKKGMQTIEDRIVLVKAHSEADALRRLRREWKQYESPCTDLNGYLSRWKIERVIDIYKLIDDEINPRGTEVYSKLGRRKMKPEYRWDPFNASNKAF